MENSIKLQVPISLSYPALEGVLKRQLVGEFIPKAEEGNTTPPYAQILDIRMAGSSTGANEVVLRVKLRILRTVLKRDQVELLVRATLGYDNAAQRLFVRNFRMESQTSSGFYNAALEVLVNKVAYHQILKKTSINLGEVISVELTKVNNLLEQGFDLKGAKLMGAVQEVRVQHLVPQPEHVSLIFELQGNLEVDIADLISLMPAKPEM